MDRQWIIDTFKEIGTGSWILCALMILGTVLTWIFPTASSCFSGITFTLKGIILMFWTTITQGNFIQLAIHSSSILIFGYCMEKHLGMVIFFSLIIGELFLVRLVEGLVLLLLAADSFCVVGAAGLLFALWTVYFCAMPQNAMDLRALRLNPRYMPVVMYFLFLIFSQGNGWLELTISLVCGYATVLVCPLGLWNYIMLPEYLEPLSALNFRTSSAV